MSTRRAALDTALREGAETLGTVSGTPRLDSELLLAHALGRPRSYLHAHPEAPLPDTAGRRYRRLLAARRTGRPVAYLLRRCEFWSLELAVGEATLIPRPETEHLVEAVLDGRDPEPPARVLDLGTGTGAVALALAAERPGWSFLGVDRSTAALALARRNARRHDAALALLQGDWYAPVHSRFDVVVSNPPYVPAAAPELTAGEARFEPAAARCGGPDGLAALREVIAGAPGHLAAGGLLAVEHGHDQGAAVRALMTAAGLAGPATRRDLAGHERVTVARRAG